MPYFDELHVLVQGSKYILTKRFRYAFEDHLIIVPAGFKTDFATVPRMFRWAFTGHDRTRKAAVIHDYLYQRKTYPRAWADDVFLQAMKESGVSAWKRYLMYSAVRMGGWVRW